MKRNVVALSLLAATVLAGIAYAVEQEIEVAARMRIGLSFSNPVNMNFTPGSGHIDYYGTPDSSTDFVRMATSGAIAVDGSVFQPSAMTGTPGSVEVNSDGTSMVNITCSADATLAASTGETITVDQVRINMNTGAAWGSADYSCAGVGGTAHPYQLTGTDSIIVGGRLVGNASVTTALYDTTNSGGVPITLRVLYQ